MTNSADGWLILIRADLSNTWLETKWMKNEIWLRKNQFNNEALSGSYHCCNFFDLCELSICPIQKWSKKFWGETSGSHRSYCWRRNRDSAFSSLSGWIIVKHNSRNLWMWRVAYHTQNSSECSTLCWKHWQYNCCIRCSWNGANETNQQRQIISSTEYRIHMQYNSRRFSNDIAILILPQTAIINRFVQPINLPSAS